MERFYLWCMRLGRRLGCHQMPQRSLFIGDRQFPLCARCTGLVVGYVLSFALLPLVQPPLVLCVIFCEIMFLDWLVQHLELHPSTNTRRLLTGTLCGYGLMSSYIQIGGWLVQHLRLFINTVR